MRDAKKIWSEYSQKGHPDRFACMYCLKEPSQHHFRQHGMLLFRNRCKITTRRSLTLIWKDQSRLRIGSLMESSGSVSSHGTDYPWKSTAPKRVDTGTLRSAGWIPHSRVSSGRLPQSPCERVPKDAQRGDEGSPDSPCCKSASVAVTPQAWDAGSVPSRPSFAAKLLETSPDQRSLRSWAKLERV